MTRKELRAARMTFGFYRFTPRKRREPLFVPPRFLPKFSSRLARVNNRDQNIVRSRIEVGKDDERDDGREQQWRDKNLSLSFSLFLSTPIFFHDYISDRKMVPFLSLAKWLHARPSVTHRYAYAHTHFLFTPLPGPHHGLGLNARRSVSPDK